jgi:hypothetical protein
MFDFSEGGYFLSRDRIGSGRSLYSVPCQVLGYFCQLVLVQIADAFIRGMPKLLSAEAH